MLALRSLVRALPKSSLRQSAAGSLRSNTRSGIQRAAWQSKWQSSYSAFSTSAIKRESAGQFDQELSAKIAQEHSLELESHDDSKDESVNEYLKSSPFTVTEKPGSHEIVLTREFGNEQIKVELSISDINNMSEEEFDQNDEDDAFDDEPEYEQEKRTINQSKGGKIDVMPEDSIAPADREGDLDYSSGPSYPIRILVTITKPGNKAIQVAAVVVDGTIDIENLTIYEKASLVDAEGNKEAREAQSLYEGPPIRNLDPELQMHLERYLEERGINAELAVFLPDYVDQKEQKEYVSWLDNLRKFIDA
ncbi:hypothetical protein PV10_00211 [Exophiala mesophila]|uniref:Mitochondrial acidic protein MAM33 n=1 Tax=Exophiala mesophila TaxID=212818 RepID=A0A0D1X3D2_EXOME|nr:uncharacterized protein PV10_00211 [Exophiala mesophila]KIV96330.1 hypothetical protein PV10_00211 [Exophiala mesophila]